MSGCFVTGGGRVAVDTAGQPQHRLTPQTETAHINFMYVDISMLKLEPKAI